MPGALPPTPGASEGEYEPESDGADAHVEGLRDYVLVERVRISADFDIGEDGDVPPPVPPTKNNARNEH